MHIPLICKIFGHRFFFYSVSEDGELKYTNFISYCYRCGLERNIINEEFQKHMHCKKDFICQKCMHWVPGVECLIHQSYEDCKKVHAQV